MSINKFIYGGYTFMAYGELTRNFPGEIKRSLAFDKTMGLAIKEHPNHKVDYSANDLKNISGRSSALFFFCFENNCIYYAGWDALYRWGGQHKFIETYPEAIEYLESYMSEMIAIAVSHSFGLVNRRQLLDFGYKDSLRIKPANINVLVNGKCYEVYKGVTYNDSAIIDNLLDSIDEKSLQEYRIGDDYWYVEKWSDEDLMAALEEVGVSLSIEHIARLREECIGMFDEKSERNEAIADCARHLFDETSRIIGAVESCLEDQGYKVMDGDRSSFIIRHLDTGKDYTITVAEIDEAA